MKHLILLFFIAAVFSWKGFTQTAYPLGLDLDDEEYRELAQTNRNIQIDLGRKSLVTQVDLTPYCPEVGNQGDMASCVGWSLGYGAMTIERAIQNGWTDRKTISENAHSALFIYNQVNQGDCRRGIRMPAALQLVKGTGNCLARHFDFRASGCEEEVPDVLLQEAAAYRIEDFVPLFLPEAAPDEKIKKIKLVLAQNKPVLVGMELRRNFQQIREGDQSWWPNLPDTTYMGSHAMVVVGFDDEKFRNPRRELDSGMEGAFRLMNSWGRSWGEEGFIWVRYAHFAQYCRHAYAIRLAESEPIRLETAEMPDPIPPKIEKEEDRQKPAERPLLRLSGAFNFRYFSGWDQTMSPATPIFEDAKVRLVENDHYILDGAWKIGDQFQLQVESEFDNGYVYVLSVDAAGKAEVHFPKSEEYNTEFKGLHESALILFSGSLLTIPARDRVLQLKKPGQDHLIVLFSTRKIEPGYLNFLCDSLSADKDQIRRTLHDVLSKDTVPPSDITYLPGTMGFEVSTRSEGRIVPLLLTVEVGE